MNTRLNSPAADLAAALAVQAEAVCRHYLSHGHREGRYWLVGNVYNAPGRSLFVRLTASPDSGGAAGKWTDAENGEHGDLLDIIAATCLHTSLRETLAEARHFLSLPQTPASEAPGRPYQSKAPTGTPEAARRLLAASRPIVGTPVQRYLAGRAIIDLTGCEALRFHPRCFYRASEDDGPDVRGAYGAMIAAVNDPGGNVTGVHRTWLAPDGSSKANVAVPRRAMGHLLGGGVRFGNVRHVMVAGEGIETILSLRQVMPAMPMIAGLSSAHLAAILFPAILTRLYVARDDDPAGTVAVKTLTRRALPLGIEVVPLEPMLGDFNEDLTALGRDRLVRTLRDQLPPQDIAAFLRS